jgi:hypothetical protein
MPGTAIGKSLNLGYAGKVSRNPFNKITSRMVKSILDGNGADTQYPIPFGAAVVVNTDNTVSLFGESGSGVSTATMANFGGIAVAEVKQALTYGYGSNNSAGQFEPNTPCDVLQIGTTTIVCSSGTPTANGKVYIVTVAGSSLAVGNFTAESAPTDGATSIEVTNARFITGKKDSATGITEVVLLNQVNA